MSENQFQTQQVENQERETYTALDLARDVIEVTSELLGYVSNGKLEENRMLIYNRLVELQRRAISYTVETAKRAQRYYRRRGRR